MGALASVLGVELLSEAIHNLGQRTVKIDDNGVGLLCICSINTIRAER